MKRWLSSICFFIILLSAIALARTAAGHLKAPLTVAAAGKYKTGISSSAEQFGLAVFQHITSHPVSQHINSFPGSAGSEHCCYTRHMPNAFYLQVEMFGNNQLSFNYPAHNFW